MDLDSARRRRDNPTRRRRDNPTSLRRANLARLRRDLTTESPRPGPDRQDLLVAVGLVLLTGLVIFTTGAPSTPGDDTPIQIPATLALSTAAVLATLWRRRWPTVLTCAVFIASAVTQTTALANQSRVMVTPAEYLAETLLVYAMARWADPLRLASGMAVVVIAVGVPAYIEGGMVAATAFNTWWVMTAAMALVMRYRAGLARQQVTRTRLTERQILARELHDSVAHHVTAISVQAQAAKFVADTDPERALEAIDTIEQIANDALDEMRRMVGILRADPDEAAIGGPGDQTIATRSAPARTLSGLTDGAGDPPVTLTGSTDLAALPAPVAAAVYRVAQESITNARRHCVGGTFIDVDLISTAGAEQTSTAGADETATIGAGGAAGSSGDELVLTVTNDGTPTTRNAGGGYGVLGMTERVEALGGRLRSGPRSGGGHGGWEVQATIPVDWDAPSPPVERTEQARQMPTVEQPR